MFRKSEGSRSMNIENNAVYAKNKGSFESEKLPTFIVDEKNRFTPRIKNGAVITLGTAPEAGSHKEGVHGLVRIDLPGLSGELSRQAIQIGMFETGPRIRSLTENNSVVVWGSDQKKAVSANLKPEVPLGDTLWSQLGSHPGVDIKTANGTLVRLRYAGGGGGGIAEADCQYLVEVNPKSERDGVSIEDFTFLN